MAQMIYGDVFGISRMLINFTAYNKVHNSMCSLVMQQLLQEKPTDDAIATTGVAYGWCNCYNRSSLRVMQLLQQE